jgi:phosphoglycerate dehydrogenase-like enzyme
VTISSKLKVLILIPAEDQRAADFREAIGSSPLLSERVDLSFADPNASGFIPAGAKDVEVVVCIDLPAELLAEAPRLKWVSFWSAGLDKRITPEIEARNLLVTSASGVHGPNIAEQVMAYMLMFTRRMPHFMRAQIAGDWARVKHTGFEELTGKTLGIVGLGHIGATLASRARSFGMRIIATKRDIARPRDGSVLPDQLYAPEDLPKLLAESDHVCIAIPYTSDTHRLFDATMLSHMKATAYLYNISRGKIVDEQALIDALRQGKLGGAGLDVFETEPLAADSPLWGMENVIITPHVAGFTQYYFARVASLFAANLERYIEGRPLENLYDPQRGY